MAIKSSFEYSIDDDYVGSIGRQFNISNWPSYTLSIKKQFSDLNLRYIFIFIFFFFTISFSTVSKAQEFTCRGKTVVKTLPIQTRKNESGRLLQYCSSRLQKTYNVTPVYENRFFCDSVTLPNDIDLNQHAHLDVLAGAVGVTGDRYDVTSDTITVGKINTSQTTFMQPNISDSNLTAATAFSTVSFNVSPSILSLVNSIDNKLDVVVQDDTEVQSLKFKYCSNLESKANIEISKKCDCDERAVTSKYGGFKICHYCQNNPIVISTAGTENYDSYKIKLVEFDTDAWSTTQVIYENWECTSSNNCQIPPFLLVSDYLNGTTLTLGKTYMLSVSVGPAWSSSNVFFKMGGNRCSVVADPLNPDGLSAKKNF